MYEDLHARDCFCLLLLQHSHSQLLLVRQLQDVNRGENSAGRYLRHSKLGDLGGPITRCLSCESKSVRAETIAEEKQLGALKLEMQLDVAAFVMEDLLSLLLLDCEVITGLLNEFKPQVATLPGPGRSRQTRT
eukprot:767926-Hanusia_phi.AAC.2